MAFEIRKSTRTKVKLRLAISGPSGSGKTLTALLIAFGMVKQAFPTLTDAECWLKVALIDSEQGRGELYANAVKAGVQIHEYLYGRITPPYSPDKYIEAIKAMEAAGVFVVVTDSLSHAWAGEGGILDIQGQASDRGGNSFTAWRKVTPQHNKLVDTVTMSNAHQIVTMRSKTEYAVEQDGKNTKVRKVGMAPVQRDGLEYEFTVVLDMAMNHTAEASKDNTDIFDGKITAPGVQHGAMLMEWLDTGAPAPVAVAPVAETPPSSADDMSPRNTTPPAVEEHAPQAPPKQDDKPAPQPQPPAEKTTAVAGDHANKTPQTTALCKSIHIAKGRVQVDGKPMSDDQLYDFARGLFKLRTTPTSLYDLGTNADVYKQVLVALNKAAAGGAA